MVTDTSYVSLDTLAMANTKAAAPSSLPLGATRVHHATDQDMSAKSRKN